MREEKAQDTQDGELLALAQPGCQINDSGQRGCMLAQTQPEAR
jgi:hypothetical protein